MIAKIYPNGHADLNGKQHPVRYFDIRKLTERECLRLMDVNEKNINILTSCPRLTRSALYKMAGNSIVVSCLYYIFKNIYCGCNQTKEPSLFDEATFRILPPPTIRMVTLCSGYDSQVMAMQRLARELNKDVDLVWWAEFDPDSNKPQNEQPAVIAHNTLFPQWKERNLGDITKIDWDKVECNGEIDLLTYSTPCQSISQAGRREGIAKGSGTHSAILWYTENAIRALKPKFLLQENVKALCNKVNAPHFNQWQQVCNDLGYDNYWAVLNAKDYGVPQNRERVFMLSVRRDLGLPTYQFPKPFKLESKVADVLEDVNEQIYFLNPTNVIKFLQMNETDKASHIVYAQTDHKLTDEEINFYRNEQREYS